MALRASAPLAAAGIRRRRRAQPKRRGREKRAFLGRNSPARLNSAPTAPRRAPEPRRRPKRSTACRAPPQGRVESVQAATRAERRRLFGRRRRRDRRFSGRLGRNWGSGRIGERWWSDRFGGDSCGQTRFEIRRGYRACGGAADIRLPFPIRRRRGPCGGARKIGVLASRPDAPRARFAGRVRARRRIRSAPGRRRRRR